MGLKNIDFASIEQQAKDLKDKVAISLRHGMDYYHEIPYQYIRLKEAKESLQQLSAILTEKNAKELEDFLEKRWQNIAGTFLDYISSPTSGMTELCLSIAQWLHQQNPSKKVYQYMMPTLTHIYEETGLFEEDIDNLPLTGVILSDDKKSLIPCTILSHLVIDEEVNRHLWYNPYVAKKEDKIVHLTDNEIEALYNHNETSFKIRESAEDIRSATENSPTLGGEIERLAVGLFRGSVMQKGSEALAANEAMEAIAKFMSYWHKLDPTTKEQFYFVKAGTHSMCLGDLIRLINEHIYIRRYINGEIVNEELVDPQDILLCAKINYDKLKDILYTNRKLHFVGLESDDDYLEDLQKDFEQLKAQLPTVKGRQKNKNNLYTLSFIGSNLLEAIESLGLISTCDLFGSQATLELAQQLNIPLKGFFIKQNYDGDTLLHWAVKNNDTELIKIILEINADNDFLSIKNEMGYTALMLAAELGHAECIEEMLGKNASFELLALQNDPGGNTALMLGASSGRLECCKAILKKNDSFELLNVKNKADENFFMRAAGSFSYEDLMGDLLNKYYSPDSPTCRDKKELMAKESDGSTILHKAAAGGQVKTLRTILQILGEEGRDCLFTYNAHSGYTPLMHAMLAPSPEAVAAILEIDASDELLSLHKTDDENYGIRGDDAFTVSQICIELENDPDYKRCYSVLLEKISFKNCHILHHAFLYAAQRKHFSVLQMLMEKLEKYQPNYLLNIKDENGDNVFCIAIIQGDVEVFNILLEKITIENLLEFKDPYGRTLLDVTIMTHFNEGFNVLFEKSMIPHLMNVDEDGFHSVMRAADNFEYLDVILKKFSTNHLNELNNLLKMQNVFGGTALISAAEGDDPRCIAAILEKNAYSRMITLKDRHNKAVLDYVEDKPEIKKEILFILSNPFLQKLNYFINTLPAFWNESMDQQFNEFLAHYKTLYTAYQSDDFKTALAEFKNAYSKDNEISALDEASLTLHFTRFIDEVIYTSQETDLSPKAQSLISRLMAVHNQSQNLGVTQSTPEVRRTMSK